MQIRDSVAIVTGASRGIGVHLADALVRRGAKVALAARSKDGLEEVAEGFRARGADALPVPTDVTDRSDLERLVQTTSQELGPVDILVNNAGVEIVGYSEELDPDQIDRVVQVNLTSVMHLSRLVLPGMIDRGRGHICNIASAAGVVARPYGVVYAATKHGVVGFSWSLRSEVAEKGVEVSVVCPAYVKDVGMFADRMKARTAADAPGAVSPISPTKVAEETMRSIERDRGHVVVGPPLVKTAGVAHMLSVDTAIAVARRTGLHRFMKKEATGD